MGQIDKGVETIVAEGENAAIARHFATEAANITPSSTAAFDAYRVRFITPHVAPSMPC